MACNVKCKSTGACADDCPRFNEVPCREDCEVFKHDPTAFSPNGNIWKGAEK